MKTQQQADREEQQRIKNLVLNYDLSTDNEPNDGEDNPSSLDPFLQRNPNWNLNTKSRKGFEKRSSQREPKLDKSSSNRTGFRARRLQLSDVDWYD
jgi:regulator of nonsense transcripts 2